ncbi:MAG: hypothetical protein V4580_17540 [Bacteroidota bacterium]
MKILFLIAGIAIILCGMLLCFTIAVYSVKEQDNDGFKFLGGSGALLLLGIILLMKGLKKRTQP